MIQLATEMAIRGSPSSRRAWVEMRYTSPRQSRQYFVALLAEGVGRNGKPVHINSGYRVALLAEGVGRNISNRQYIMPKVGSPSSRRAWVEITINDLFGRWPMGRPPRGGRG